MTRPDRDEVARLLAQAAEMGFPPLVLPTLGRREALARAAACEEASIRKGKGAVGPGAAPMPAAAGTAPSMAVTPPAPSPTTEGGAHEDLSLPDDFEAFREFVLTCPRCRLSENRTQVVFADGQEEGRVVVVGEAPGANEDRTGLPFVGAAGQLLDLALATVGLSRERDVYICNVIKCRPPGNRNPRPDEIEACSPYLVRQIEHVAPEVILAAGTIAARHLTGLDRPLGKLRGEVYRYEGIPVVVTYHPAALLRNPGWTRATWEDLQLLRSLLDGGG